MSTRRLVIQYHANNWFINTEKQTRIELNPQIYMRSRTYITEYAISIILHICAYQLHTEDSPQENTML